MQFSFLFISLPFESFPCREIIQLWARREHMMTNFQLQTADTKLIPGYLEYMCGIITSTDREMIANKLYFQMAFSLSSLLKLSNNSMSTQLLSSAVSLKRYKIACIFDWYAGHVQSWGFLFLSLQLVHYNSAKCRTKSPVVQRPIKLFLG